MNIDSLKAGFKAYLEEKGKLTEENEAQYNENTSIFSYANEFKAYINKNCNTSGVNIQSKSVSELLKMEISESGKIIDPEELEAYDEALEAAEMGQEADVEESDETESEEVDETAVVSDVKDELAEEISADVSDSAAAEIVDGFESKITGAVGEEAAVDGIEEADIFFDVFNELLQNDQFKDAIDADGQDGISNDEFAGFINSIKGFDENELDVSVDDLLTASSQINEGKFSFISVPSAESSSNNANTTTQIPATETIQAGQTTTPETVNNETVTTPEVSAVETGSLDAGFTGGAASTENMTVGGCGASSGALDSMNSELEGLQSEKSATESDLSTQTDTMNATQTEKEQVVGGLCSDIETGNSDLSCAQDDMSTKAEAKETAQCDLEQAQQNTQCSQQQADKAGNCLKNAQADTAKAQDTSNTAADNNQQAIQEEGVAQAASDDANTNLDTAVGNTGAAQGVADTKGQELETASVAADEAFSVYNVKNAKVEKAQSEYDNAKAQQKNASQNIFQRIANWVKSALNKLHDAIFERDKAQAEAERKAKEEEKAQVASDEALEALEARKDEQDEAQTVADAAQVVLDKKTGEREVSDQEYADALVALASSMEAEENAESEYNTAFDNYLQMNNYQVDAEGRLQDANGNYISAAQVAQELEVYVQGLVEQRDTKETEYDEVIVATAAVISGDESKIQELDTKITDLQEQIKQEEENIALQEAMITELSTEQSEINAANGAGGIADGIASIFGGGTAADQKELDNKKAALEEALKTGDAQKIQEAYRAIYGDKEIVVDASGNIVTNPNELTEEELAECSVANVKDLSDENLAAMMHNDAEKKIEAANTVELINNGSVVCDGEEVSMEDVNAILKEQMAAMAEDMDNAADRQGLISKRAGELNKLLGLGTSEVEARAQVDVYMQLAEQLDSCTDPVEYAALFKQITGKDFNAATVAQLLAYDKVSKGEEVTSTTSSEPEEGKVDLSNAVNSMAKTVNESEDYDKNSLALTHDNKARESIEDYKETQETVKDATIGVVSGIASTMVVTACTAAGVCAAPFTAGASLSLVATGFAIAGGTGAAVSTGLNAIDSIYDADGDGSMEFNYSWAEAGEDAAIGCLNGMTALLANGAGSAIAKGTGVKYFGSFAEGFIDGGVSAGGEYTIHTAFDDSLDFSFEQFAETTAQGGIFGGVVNVGFTAAGDLNRALKSNNLDMPPLDTPDLDALPSGTNPALPAPDVDPFAQTAFPAPSVFDDAASDAAGDAFGRTTREAAGDAASDAAGRAANDAASNAANDAAGKAAADAASNAAADGIDYSDFADRAGVRGLSKENAKDILDEAMQHETNSNLQEAYRNYLDNPSDATLKKLYRTAQKEFHPDYYQGGDDASKFFNAIYAILSAK